MLQINGARVLVTGASRGLGTVIARRLWAEGAELVLAARDGERLRRLADELTGSSVLEIDLSQPQQVETLAAVLGPVDVLVSNAGVQAEGRLASLDPGAIDRALAVNLASPIHLARALIPGMLARGRGHLVFVASLAGKVPMPGASLYSATKFGLRGLAFALRSELAPSNVGVSLVSPYFVSGVGMWAAQGRRAPMREAIPEAVADQVVRAVRHDLAEVVVGPLPARLGARVLAAYPELAGRMRSAVGEIKGPSARG